MVAGARGQFVRALNYLEMALALAGDKQQPPGSCICSLLFSSPSLSSWEQLSLTRGGSGGGSLLWVLTFTGLHRPLLFSFTCFLLLTTPILSESTPQSGDVSRSSEPQYRRGPPTPSGWPIRKVGGRREGEQGRSKSEHGVSRGLAG